MLPFESLLKTLQTGSGFWNPLVWIVAIIVALLVVLIVRGFGRKDYKKGTSQTQAFLSGNPEYEKERMHIKGSNVYWGFSEVMNWIIKLLKKMHTGNVSDYVLWFVIIIAILFLSVIIPGGAI